MSVIYYRQVNNEKAKRLLSVIEAEAAEEKISTYQSIQELSERLCMVNSGRNIAILYIVSMDELNEIISIKRLLRDIRLLLVFPKNSPEIVSAGYKLYPRYISYADGNFNDVGLVLRRMIKLVKEQII